MEYKKSVMISELEFEQSRLDHSTILENYGIPMDGCYPQKRVKKEYLQKLNATKYSWVLYDFEVPLADKKRTPSTHRCCVYPDKTNKDNK